MVSGLFSIPKQASQCAPGAIGAVAAPLHRFLAGPENALLSRALAAVHAPSAATNPLVITGARGTGKTLLLELLVDEFQRTYEHVKVLLTTAVDLARAYAHAVQTDSISEFRQRYSRLHLLAIDDLHRLEGKPAAQQELGQLVDSLAGRGCLALATLRAHPLKTTELADPLASRFSAGLVVPLALPQAAVRRALVEHFAAENEVDLSPAVVDKLASAGDGPATAPQLRGAVIRLAEMSRQRGTAATDELALELLAEHETGGRPSLKAIAAAVSKQFDVSVADLRGKSRLHSIIAARGVAMHLARELAGLSYAEIGRYFGNRDHTTVIHACKKMAATISEPQVRQEIDQLRLQLTEDCVP